MDQRKLIELQAERGAKAVGRDYSIKSLNVVTNECRKMIEDNSFDYRDLEGDAKREAIKNIIVKYVTDYRPIVEGFTDDENKTEVNKLVDRLVEDITNYGILTNAMLDPDIYEIRANGKEIKVEIAGRCTDLRDRDGKIVSFESTVQQEIIMRKLLGDEKLTPKDAMVSTSTIEGFRIAAVHSSANSLDPNNPSGDKYHSFVLRKFKKVKMELDQVVKNKTMSDNMAKLCQCFADGSLTAVACGVTASGKTTTLNAMLQEIKDNVRVILIQNPSEIDLRKKDASGRLVNDVLHLEAKEKENPTQNDATFVNAMAMALRLSPNTVVLGELRYNAEFEQAMMIMKSGHNIFSTYHAGSGEEAIQRFCTAYMASSGEGVETALPSITSVLNFIVIQKLLNDGTRKVLSITEVIGVDEDNHAKPILNEIYKFQTTGEVIYGEDGTIKDIVGVHKRVGKISDKTLYKLQLAGVRKELYEQFTKEVNENEVETYTGSWR